MDSDTEMSGKARDVSGQERREVEYMNPEVTGNAVSRVTSDEAPVEPAVLDERAGFEVLSIEGYDVADSPLVNEGCFAYLTAGRKR